MRFPSACALLLLLFSSVHAREVVVRPGESLSSIAERELGAMSRWEEIARRNNITDPRKLKAGMRLIIPDDGMMDPRMDPAFVDGAPSVRRLSGAVRYRPAASSAWGNLTGATALVPGSGLMTANTGTADLRIGDAHVELSPYGVLWIQEIFPGGEGAMLKLELGSMMARSRSTPLHVDAGVAKVELIGSDARISIDETGVMRVTVRSGQARLITPDGRSTMLDAGRVATLTRGSMSPVIRDPASSIVLISPANSQTLTDRNVLFEWTPVSGASEYRFILEPAGGGRSLEERAPTNKIEVKNIPEGRYSWHVIPVGPPDAVASAPSMVTISRPAMMAPAPLLELSTPRWVNGRWWLEGRTVPGAWLTIGAATTQAGADGSFTQDLGEINGALIIGVEARMTPTGPVSRGAAYVASRPQGRSLPLWINVPSGSVWVDRAAAPPALVLEEGGNVFAWEWRVGDVEAARGSMKIAIDLTPPQITGVRATPQQVNSGDNVTIYVAAMDRGAGLADPSTAMITVAGPDGFTASPRAMQWANGEYVFQFSTPKNLKTGYLRVTKLEVADLDGNATILSAEGMTTETTNPEDKRREFFKNLLLIGIGALIGGI